MALTYASNLSEDPSSVRCESLQRLEAGEPILSVGRDAGSGRTSGVRKLAQLVAATDVHAWKLLGRDLGDTPEEVWVPIASPSAAFQQQASTLRDVREALSSLPMEALIATGRGIGPSESEPADNTEVQASVEHDRALPFADLVVTHGGPSRAAGLVLDPLARA